MNTLIQFGLRVVLGVSMVLPALAQNYPNKSIRLVVPFPAGGSTDQVARLLAPKLSANLGQQIIVDNKGGASGSIGATDVARAAPDGYTMMLVFDTHATNPYLIKKLQYDTFKDLSHVTLVASTPLVLVAHPSVPANNLKELIALAKAKPNTLNFGSVGNGSSGHLTGELLNRLVGINLTHIPYKGGGPAMQDLLAGQVQLMFTTVTLAGQHVKAGKLKMLASLGGKRTTEFPNVATSSEQGISGFDVIAWYGLLGPANLPKGVSARWQAELAKVVKDPAIKERLDHLALDIVLNSPEQFETFVRKEGERWGKIIKDKDIQPD